MLFYCEAKYDSIAILDVHNLADIEKLWNIYNITTWNPKDKRSLIELTDLKVVKYRGLREGFWYDIPEDFWNNLEFDHGKFAYEQEDPSLLFRLSAIYKGIEEIDFISYRIKQLEE